ncbi:MAG: ATP-dependent Clp protease ATP-binding subunit ClpA [Bdellovibrionales bacterium]|nr:ATP-dependent Clp protease ATP-binding subunit ClpA [Bdellovibrionales bacterium]
MATRASNLKLEVIINSAVVKANLLRHEYLTLELVFKAILEDQQVRNILESCKADLHVLEHELDAFIATADNFSYLSEDAVEELSLKQFADQELRQLAKENGISYQPEISLGLQRVIQRAAIHVQSSGKKDILGANILVAFFNEPESFVCYLLEAHGVEKFDVVRLIAHGIDRPVNAETGINEAIRNEFGEAAEKPKSALEEYCTNLNNEVIKGKIDPIVGRDEEIERVCQILSRRRKNNPLLVGEAGVGKTAIAEGLAFRIVNNDVPDILKPAIVFSLDLASLLAGTKYRGDFEQRLKNVLKELKNYNEEKNQEAILFIDEIHTIMGAGATSGGSMDASNLLKPALSSGELRCIGSTTYEEYRKFIEKDAAFSRRFQKVDVLEPTPDDTQKILLGLRQKFEEHHNVKYSNAIIKLIVDLAAKHITDRKNPDKSIDVIDEVGAMIRILPADKRHIDITQKDVETVVAMMAKIPKMSVATDERDKLRSLKSNLKLLIFGQDDAVNKVADAILLSRSGLANDQKPMGSFLFTGPTGVGKTELAKQLARELGIHLERFDMSEYMEKHSVAKLIGAPPGYVGHDNGGLLTDVMKKHPHAVLLLDEIEKAHPDIFNILLQIMDHGTLTDSHGRSTDFRNVVIIMTSNAGAKEMEGGAIGLGKNLDHQSAKRDLAIKSFFTPEFRNRLDSIVHFNKLGDDQVLKIVDKFLIQLETKLSEKNVELVVEEKTRIHLAKVGFDPQMGARPLARIIDHEIKKPLSHEILFGKLEKGGTVVVSIDENDHKIVFKFPSEG